MSKPELRDGKSNPTLQLAKTASEAALAGRKKQEWKPPGEICKEDVTLDYLASFHSSM